MRWYTERKVMQLKNHLLIVVLVPVIVLVGAFSYYRFIVQHDYMVTYEGICDPTTDSCYVGCEDDACESTYPYMTVEKYAADLYAQCGPDITDCEAASQCVEGEQSCTITFCDASVDECMEAEEEEVLEEESAPTEESEELEA